jgi:hypothetical protein
VNIPDASLRYPRSTATPISTLEHPIDFQYEDEY